MEKILRTIFDFGTKIGLGELECFALWGEGTTVEIKEQKIENLKLSSFQSIGIRALQSHRMGIAYLFEFDTDTIKTTLEELSKTIPYLDEDEHYVFPEPFDCYPSVECYDDNFNKVSINDKISIAMEIEQTTYKYDRLIKRVRHASYGDNKTYHMIKNTLGLSCAWQATEFSSSVMAIAENNGNSESGWDAHNTRHFSFLSHREVAQRAAEEAVLMLGARPIQTGKLTIVLSPRVASDFLGFFTSIVSGEAVLKKKSLLADKLNNKVVSGCIDIIDNGLMRGGIGTAQADDEGVPKATHTLIKEGILKTYLHNVYTTGKLGYKTTGNAYKGSIKSLPTVDISNCSITSSSHRYKRPTTAAIDSNGLYIGDVMGLHTANPISGDFSVGVSGFKIKNGRWEQPVRGIAIADNILSLFNKVHSVDTDMRWFGKVGSPSLLLEEMVVSGE